MEHCMLAKHVPRDMTPTSMDRFEKRLQKQPIREKKWERKRERRPIDFVTHFGSKVSRVYNFLFTRAPGGGGVFSLMMDFFSHLDSN